MRRNLFLILLLILVTFLVYAPSLKNGFVWDDFLVVTDNHFIKSWKNFPLMFTRQYLTSPEDLPYLTDRNIGSGEISYRPVVTLTYFVDYWIWKLNPFGYHLRNLVLHLINTVLLYWFCFLVLKKEKWAFWASLIFALHPIQAEAVAGISFREDLLAFLFFLSSLLLYIHQKKIKRGSKRYAFYFGSLFSYFLAVFSKETALVLPLIVLLWDSFFDAGGKNEFVGFYQEIFRLYRNQFILPLGLVFSYGAAPERFNRVHRRSLCASCFEYAEGFYSLFSVAIFSDGYCQCP